MAQSVGVGIRKPVAERGNTRSRDALRGGKGSGTDDRQGRKLK